MNEPTRPLRAMRATKEWLLESFAAHLLMVLVPSVIFVALRIH